MKALFKDFFRGMSANKGKFISVFFIILLGAAFFSGLRSSRGDMLRSAEEYYDNYSLHDISVISTAGLTDDDISAITAIDGVATAEGVYMLDVFDDEGSTVKLMSCTSQTNLPEVIEGRMPESEDECLVDSLLIEIGEYEIGSQITFYLEDDSLSSQLIGTTFTITGYANLPQYMDLNRGTGSIGNGDIDGFILLMPQAFTVTYYTQINVLVSGAATLDSFEDEYDSTVQEVMSRVEGIEETACQRRYDELYAQAYNQVYEQVVAELRTQFPNLPDSFITYFADLYIDENAADIEEQIQSAITVPEWYVLDRSSITSYSNFINDAERINSLGKLLPIVFFLVATLVSLTAMTRLVEEERRQIGTLKALGSSNSAVLMRYLMYALIPTLFGSVTGVLIGEKLFPLAIIKTYGMLYRGLTTIVLPYNLLQGVIAVLASIISTGVAALAASIKIVREAPSQIMRPESPKPGKRVLLEHVTPLWNRLSFTQKSTVRNLFRNKKRFIMTIIGVAGCMGLILVGLGLHDSISEVVDTQFTELTHYNAYTAVSGDISEIETLTQDLLEEQISSLIVYQKSVDVQGNGSSQTVTLCVPQSVNDISSYYTFRTRSGHNSIQLNGNSAIISEKTANSLGVSVGDSVTFSDGGSSYVTVEISAIYENYVGNYIFITSEYYSQLFGGEPSYNMLLLEFEDSAQSQVGSILNASSCVQGVSYISDLVDWADDTLSSLNTIVLIVLAAAALLAIVVLYNLNSINIAERKRELATLKVLGFYDSEVASYVYKENILLTIIGILLGVVLGIFLHQYVITSIEVDMIMFGRSIFWYSYILGALLTFAFSVIINLIMYRSIRRIDMIESLKSVE